MQSGSIVKNADGTVMTVKAVTDNQVTCTWFVGADVKEATFELESLTELTAEQVKEYEREVFEQALKVRADELSKADNGKKVIPIWYLDPVDPDNGKPIIGFLKEPGRPVKGSIMDALMVSRSRAASIALESSLMKDISDSRIVSTSQIYDAVNTAAGLEALNLVKIATSQFKKK